MEKGQKRDFTFMGHASRLTLLLGLCALLDLSPDRVMLGAAHNNDLAAAQVCGLRTGFIARPDEQGPGTGETAPSVPVDCARLC